MPSELEDAAYVDGAGPFTAFARIFAPNAVPAFLTVFLFSTVWYWNDSTYVSFFMIDRMTLAMKMSNYMTFAAFYDPVLNLTDREATIAAQQAGCLLMILPVLVLFIVFQRYFIESIEKTGIVG